MRIKNNVSNFFPKRSQHILNLLIFLFLSVSTSVCHKTKHQNYFFQKLREINLDSRDEFLLGALCNIGTIAPNGDYIILDLVTPQVLVFDLNGHGKMQIARGGSGPGEFRYPKSLIYYDTNFYLYDNGLLRISLYDTTYRFKNSFSLTLPIDEIKVTNDGRFFGYRSTPFLSAFHHVCEFNEKGDILNSFVKQSINFIAPAATEGGGILLINNYLYVITPYEYMLSKFDFNGNLIKEVHGKSSHYMPISKNINEEAISTDLTKLQQFHNSWSHIRQIIQIDAEMIGIVYAEPGESHVFLDLYDLELNWIGGEILVPNYSGKLFTQGNRIYLLQQAENYIKGQVPNPVIVEYLLKAK